MSITDRDRKVVMIVLPLVLLLGYWFLLLAPKRDEAASAQQQLTKVEQERDQAVATARQLDSAWSSFAADYTALVRLGKAIPTRLDMPSVIVQLDSAARGTGIRFKKIATGKDDSAGAAGASGGGQSGSAPTAPAPGTGNGSQPANAGGAPAQSTPGQQAEGAATKTNTANAQTQGNADAAQQSGLPAGDTATSQSSKKGGLGVGGGSAAAQSGAQAAAGSCAAGLVCVPLEFEFSGRFLRLADFFHRLKRFVRVVDQRIDVRGRLLTIDSLKLSSDAISFPNLKAEVSATIYLAPAQQGTTAGATPSGPAQTQPTAAGSGSDNNVPSATPVSPAAPGVAATP